jgi:acetylornithine aminotransferase
VNNILICTNHKIRFENIIKAKNCTLYDSFNNKFLDLESGVWCTSVGHNNPRITKVIQKQSKKIIHTGYCYINPIIKKASESILDITGITNGKSLFLNSGSEAVEFSIKIMKEISDKPYILTLKDSYLSAFGSSGKKSKNEWILFDWIENKEIKNLPFNKISAFIFEPGSSSGLVNFPPIKMIAEIIDNVRANNGFIIVNEVTTGIGRTGKWFGYNHYDFIPDIVAIGKGLGNGYPVSCIVLSKKVIERLDLNKFHYSQSHQNDPLGAVIANEVISIIKDKNLIERSKKAGDKIINRLNLIKEKSGIIKEVRGRALMIAIEFIKDKKGSYAERINNELLKRNIILVKRPGYEVFRLDPALTIKNKDIEYFLTSLEEIISDLR